MKVGSRQWKALVRGGAAALGVVLEEEHLERFGLHGRELLEWNRRVNLTAITDPEAVAVKHFVDACAAAPWIPARARILDVGSGGGFPGIPLAVLRPLGEVVLLDPSRKKANFLRHVLRTLGLGNASVAQARAEDLAGDPELRRSFDIVISRALGTPARIVPLAAPLLRPGGRGIAMAGRLDGSEAGRPIGPEAVPCRCEAHAYRLPGGGDRRSLWIFDPYETATPDAE